MPKECRSVTVKLGGGKDFKLNTVQAHTSHLLCNIQHFYNGSQREGWATDPLSIFRVIADDITVCDVAPRLHLRAEASINFSQKFCLFLMLFSVYWHFVGLSEVEGRMGTALHTLSHTHLCLSHHTLLHCQNTQAPCPPISVVPSFAFLCTTIRL